MRRFQIIPLLALLVVVQPARAELLQLELSIFGMD